ncbi:anti-sigma-D factor RsdA [Nocardia sp. NBC_00508]|uniref:anti-sigma-D factor RsdA n=1 Tax=Nocardia sp. NBC_00508 TaxID=2975992 RepID=UPI002E80C930|nr:anti-sigma-D factor RsdA [Nocardia sp. NBC_00508]WUD68566.1 anti-sigma-D factor RsdA [Nocardia sp. NBC_00508]
MARDGERGRGDWKARLGSRNSGPYAEASGDTDPVDIAAVRRDDALIDAIASDGPVHTDSAEEYQLATLLADWRAELIAAPMPAEPDLDVIVAAVNQEIGARQARIGAQSGGRLRLLRPIMGTAAALALVIGGMTAFSYNAEPGDPLWRVKEVVFSEQAQTTVVQRADTDLNQASALVTQNPTQAKARLERAKENADQVSDPGKRTELMTEWQRLLVELRKVSPELADQLEATVPQTTDPRATPGNGATTRPNPATGGSGTTILQQPAEQSGKPTQSADATAPNGGTPTTVPPVTTPPPAATTPPQATVEPTTLPQQPPTPPTTDVRPPTAEPTADTGGPTAPQQPPPTRVPTQDSYTPPTVIVPGVPNTPGTFTPSR